MEQPRIELRDLSKNINGRPIVKNVNLSLYPGEVFGLIGPNGAGKSTTIKMIVGMMRISSGEIFYEGQDYKNHFVDIKEHISAIVENPDLYEYMNGTDQLKMFAKFYPEVSEDRIREVVQFVKLDQAIQKKSKQYSLGMKQRLALAIALLNDPDFLVLDEPTNGLDPQGIRELRLLLRDLAAKKGLTVLVSSHILSEMQALCDRVGLIHHGELLKVGKVQDIIDEIQDHGIRILVDKPEILMEHLLAKQVGFERQNDYLRLQCDKEYINSLLQDAMNLGLSIYAVELDHGTLEESFMRLIEEKGGAIQ